MNNVRLSIEQAKKYLQGMHRLWLCDEWGQPYNSKQCKDCDSHDDCLDIVLSSESMSDIAQDLLDTIEALRQENEQLRAQVARMKHALETILNECNIDPAYEYPTRKILNDDTTDYHNPADVEALRKIKDCIKQWNESGIADWIDEIERIVDKAIGGC